MGSQEGNWLCGCGSPAAVKRQPLVAAPPGWCLARAEPGRRPAASQHCSSSSLLGLGQAAKLTWWPGQRLGQALGQRPAAFDISRDRAPSTSNMEPEPEPVALGHDDETEAAVEGEAAAAAEAAADEAAAAEAGSEGARQVRLAALAAGGAADASGGLPMGNISAAAVVQTQPTTEEEVWRFIIATRTANPEVGVKRLVKLLKTQHPDYGGGAKQVREGLKAETVLMAQAHVANMGAPVEYTPAELSKRDTCAHCYERTSPATRKLCGGCKQAVYCSAKCQKKHWKAGHNQQCTRQRNGNKKAKGGRAKCTDNIFRGERLLSRGEYRKAREFFAKGFLGGSVILESLVFQKPLTSSLGLSVGEQGTMEGDILRRGDIVTFEMLKGIFGAEWDEPEVRTGFVASPLLGMSKTFQAQHAESKLDKDIEMALRYAQILVGFAATFNHMFHTVQILSCSGTSVHDVAAAAKLATRCLKVDVAADPTFYGDSLAISHKQVLLTAIATHHLDSAAAAGTHTVHAAGSAAHAGMDLYDEVVQLDPLNAGSHFNVIKSLPIKSLLDRYGADQFETTLLSLIEQCEAGTMLYGDHYLSQFQHGLKRVQAGHQGYIFS